MRKEGRGDKGRERGGKWQYGCQVLSKFGHMGSKGRHIREFIKSLKRMRKKTPAFHSSCLHTVDSCIEQ